MEDSNKDKEAAEKFKELKEQNKTNGMDESTFLSISASFDKLLQSQEDQYKHIEDKLKAFGIDTSKITRKKQ